MSKNFDRDEKGDIINPKMPSSADLYFWWSQTGMINSYDNIYFHPNLAVYGFQKVQSELSRQFPKFQLIELYDTPDDDPNDLILNKNNWLLKFLFNNFKEIFDFPASFDNTFPVHKYHRVIVDKKIYNEINSFIVDYNLSNIHDTIIEIIAIAQDKYKFEIDLYGDEKYQGDIKSAKKEANTLIEIIDRICPDFLPAEYNNPLSHISFIFQDKTIKLKNSMLITHFVRNAIEQMNDDVYKNWKLHLQNFHKVFHYTEIKDNFKYMFAKSLYNFFIKGKFFANKSKATYPDDLMRCISKIIEFSLIPLNSKDETIDENVPRIIRNWIIRKELKESPVFLKLPANKEVLLKYFEPSFINLTGDLKKAYALNLAQYINIRFDIPGLIPEFAHIIQCLVDGHFFSIKDYIFAPNEHNSPIPDFDSYKFLRDSIKNDRKLLNLKFKVEGDDHEYEFKERLPHYIIESALKNYYNVYQEDFESDVLKSDFTITSIGHYIVNNYDYLSQPEERFIVRFIKSFYDFLLNEFPFSEKEYKPSVKYYSIITLILRETNYFRNRYYPDWVYIDQVKHLHSLAK